MLQQETSAVRQQTERGAVVCDDDQSRRRPGQRREPECLIRFTYVLFDSQTLRFLRRPRDSRQKYITGLVLDQTSKIRPSLP